MKYLAFLMLLPLMLLACSEKEPEEPFPGASVIDLGIAPGDTLHLFPGQEVTCNVFYGYGALKYYGALVTLVSNDTEVATASMGSTSLRGDSCVFVSSIIGGQKEDTTTMVIRIKLANQIKWLSIPIEVSRTRQLSDGSYLEELENSEFWMIKVRGGIFTMGERSEDPWRPYGVDTINDENPPIRVQVSDFYMSQYEVTLGLWEDVMANKEEEDYYFDWNQSGIDRAKGGVAWDEAQTFVERLSELTGKKYRLPTEAEWEYAARGGDCAEGKIYAGTHSLAACAWFKDNSRGQIHSVGYKAPNELGLYDMLGNVEEWCSDWYEPFIYKIYQDHGYGPNPTGPEDGYFKVKRGGSYANAQRDCRITERRYSDGLKDAIYTGIRIVRSAE